MIDHHGRTATANPSGTLFGFADEKPANPGRIQRVLHAAGSATSAAAGERVRATGRADTDRARIVEYLFAHERGATRDELEVALGMTGNSLRPRVHELLGHAREYVAAGGEVVLVETDETRPTRTGSAAVVLRHRRWMEARTPKGGSCGG